MSSTVYLITPPFTQLNTPYPATAYLKGFLISKGVNTIQADLGIDVTLEIFNQKGLQQLFKQAAINQTAETSANAKRILLMQEEYTSTIDAVIKFLQGHNPTLAHRIASRKFLPEASRFAQVNDLSWAFGTMGVQDQAKHIATLYLEDIADLIKELVDEHFGFSRYAERLGRSANSFDELYDYLQSSPTYVDEILLAMLKKQIDAIQPAIVAMSVPFPGNLYTGFRCGQFIKQQYPHIKVIMGGGFPNTELRSLSDIRVFKFVDFITLDDGEAPLEQLINHLDGKQSIDSLKRTFVLQDGKVVYINNASCRDYKQGDLATPDYSDLRMNEYIDAIEVVNPMHRLWSDGRWNKLTMAHGCYWGKCTFCDISLDYIKNYEPIAASVLVDRMETLIRQTGNNGFHFVDEAAPPALMRALAIEIIKRKLVVSWWTNIRFEKSFTRDLCLLLKASGCIAVSGGLEVASNRLLQLINKGITVEQVAVVTRYFTEAGIMVHAYLMYGFPTQTAQETIDSLEMVRQLFKTGVLQSAFWHLFTMTAHSPVGLEPAKYKVQKVSEAVGSFANNDIEHIDPVGDHERFSDGLKKSLFNYMHGIGLEEPLHKWFEFKVPKTGVDPNFIQQALDEEQIVNNKPETKYVWLGKVANVEFFTQSKKGNSREMAAIDFISSFNNLKIQLPKAQADWLLQILPLFTLVPGQTGAFKPGTTRFQLQQSYEANVSEDFELFWDNKPVNQLYKVGLLAL
ncbi:MAG: radical SAM protein [Sphingobacteriales bacterium]|nr:MAG: radical SAM protein [Sphingobacteriales bacterium]